MDFRLLISGIGVFLIAGCGCVNHGHDEKPEAAGEIYNLTLNVFSYQPHCGGMAPTQEMFDRMTSPASGQKYFMYKDSLQVDKGEFQILIADDDGAINVNLEEGEYYLIVKEKRLSLEEFIKLKKIEGIHYQHEPDSCYEKWKNTADFSIHLTSDTTVQFTINNKCFTGTNPCMMYTGPHPP